MCLAFPDLWPSLSYPSTFSHVLMYKGKEEEGRKGAGERERERERERESIKYYFSRAKDTEDNYLQEEK